MSEPRPAGSERTGPPDMPPRDPQWWDARYLSGDIPWDTGITPPEVVRLVQSGVAEKGWAIDLGCGSGVTSRFLARNGFRVVGLDLSSCALRRGAAAAGSEALPCSFVRASVADLSFLRMQLTLAVDVGCFHSLPAEARRSYVFSLAEHTVPDGSYLLYAFVRPDSPEVSGEATSPGVSFNDVAAFAPWFALRSTSHGDDMGRSSAWFWMQRTRVRSTL